MKEPKQHIKQTNLSKQYIEGLHIPHIFFMGQLTLALYFFATTGLAIATEKQGFTFIVSPESIIQEIRSRGAQTIVSELYADSAVWYSVLREIASGDETWLNAAVALRSGADAATSEMLSLAVGEALENNPKQVFENAFKAFSLDDFGRALRC